MLYKPFFQYNSYLRYKQVKYNSKFKLFLGDFFFHGFSTQFPDSWNLEQPGDQASRMAIFFVGLCFKMGNLIEAKIWISETKNEKNME